MRRCVRCVYICTNRKENTKMIDCSFGQRALNREKEREGEIINCHGVYRRTRRTTFTNCHEYDRTYGEANREWETKKNNVECARNVRCGNDFDYFSIAFTIARVTSIFNLAMFKTLIRRFFSVCAAHTYSRISLQLLPY